MTRKIKPQRAQRITESCYFYISSPLCHSVISVVFRNLISKISKVFGVLVTATRDSASVDDRVVTKHPIISNNLLELKNEYSKATRHVLVDTPRLLRKWSGFADTRT